MNEIWFEYNSELTGKELYVQVLFNSKEKESGLELEILDHYCYHGVSKIPLKLDNDLVYDKTCKAIRNLEIEQECK